MTPKVTSCPLPRCPASILPPDPPCPPAFAASPNPDLPHHIILSLSVSLHPVTIGWCHGGLSQGGQGFWVPTACTSPLVPGFLAVSVADHTTGTTQLAWQTQGHGSTAGGRVRVPLGERSRPFQVCWVHRDQPGGFQWDSASAARHPRLMAAAPRSSCWHWWISRARRVSVLTM